MALPAGTLASRSRARQKKLLEQNLPRIDKTSWTLLISIAHLSNNHQVSIDISGPGRKYS